MASLYHIPPIANHEQAHIGYTMAMRQIKSIFFVNISRFACACAFFVVPLQGGARVQQIKLLDQLDMNLNEMRRIRKQKFLRRIFWELIASLVIGAGLAALLWHYNCREDFGTIVGVVTASTFVTFLIIDYFGVYLDEKWEQENTDPRYPGYYIFQYDWKSPKFILKFVLWNLLIISVGVCLIAIVEVTVIPAILYFGTLIALIGQYIWDNKIKKKFDDKD